MRVEAAVVEVIVVKIHPAIKEINLEVKKN
jgi:hypothetical protein